jgi:hypothetical protein
MFSGGIQIGYGMELKPDQETWSKMIHMFSNDNHQGSYLATLGFQNRPNAKKEIGLVNSHAYSVIRCVELQGGDIKLVQIRNPWGSCT